MNRTQKILLLCVAAAAVGLFFSSHYEVPILMYHRVQVLENEKDGLSVCPETFERQMEFLKVHAYRVISLSEFLSLLKSGKRIPWGTLVITFDDGTADNIVNAYPILKKMNFPATIFMITSNIGKPGSLTEEDLRLLDGSGISIGSHTVTHAYLPDLATEKEIEYELVGSKNTLEAALDHPVTLFSYPAGGFTERVKEAVKKAGFEGAVTTNHGRARHDPFSLHRIKIKESSGSLFNFWLKTSGFYHVGRKRVSAESSDKAD